MCVQQEVRGKEGASLLVSPKIVSLYQAAEVQPSSSPRMISSNEMAAVLAAMISLILESLSALTDVHANNVTGQSRAQQSLTQASEAQVAKQTDEIEKFRKQQEEANNLSWWAKTINKVLTGLALALTLVFFGPAVFAVAVAAMILVETGALDKMAEGIEKATGIPAIVTKIVFVIAVVAITHKVSGMNVLGQTGLTGTAKGLATFGTAVSTAGSTGVTAAFTTECARMDTSLTDEQRKQRGEMAAMIINVVLGILTAIASMKNASSLPKISDSIKKVTSGAELISLGLQVLSSFVTYSNGQLSIDLGTTKKNLMNNQTFMTLCGTLVEFMASSTKRDQRMLKGDMETYESTIADFGTLNIDRQQLAQLLAR